MDILKRITDIRKTRNMSVYELAKKSGISHNTIYRWYSKNYVPSLDTLKILCQKGFEMQMVEFFAVDCDLIPATQETKKLIEVWTKLDNKQKDLINQILINFENK